MFYGFLEILASHNTDRQNNPFETLQYNTDHLQKIFVAYQHKNASVHLIYGGQIISTLRGHQTIALWGDLAKLSI